MIDDRMNGRNASKATFERVVFIFFFFLFRKSRDFGRDNGTIIVNRSYFSSAFFYPVEIRTRRFRWKNFRFLIERNLNSRRGKGRGN